MKASVLMITHNHSRFIAQAIHSVLKQQVDFDYELVIGEDCSTDGTRDIVLQLQRQYPKILRVLLPDQNLGMLPNLAATWKQCRGEYFAFLEGDDHWTSPQKLRRQVDLLESNPNYSFCFHNVNISTEGSSTMEVCYTEPMQSIYTLADVLKGNTIHTCSVVCRANLFGEFPAWYFKCPVGDWPLHVLNAMHGNIGYLNEVMAVYRKHDQGVWSTQHRPQILVKTIKTAEMMRASLEPRHAKIIDTTIAWCYYELIRLYASREDYGSAGKAATACLKRFPLRTDTEPLYLLKLAASARYPRIYQLLKRVFYKAAPGLKRKALRQR